LFEYIAVALPVAESTTSALKPDKDDITGFFAFNFLPTSWRYHRCSAGGELRAKHLRANTALNYKARSFFPSAPLKVSQHLAKNQRCRSRTCIQISSQVFQAYKIVEIRLLSVNR
jgi:hypothetical protein